MFDLILMAVATILACAGYAMIRLRRFDVAIIFILLSFAVVVIGERVTTKHENNAVDVSKCSLIGKGIDLTGVGNNHRSVYKCENDVIYIR